MNRSRWRSHLTALITAIVACVGLLGLSTAPAWAAAGTITEFPLPTAGRLPAGITAGPDGNLWFTESLGDNIGRITPKGHIKEFPIPPALGAPAFITAGPDGNLWFTAMNDIGRITTKGAITGFPIPTARSRPLGITAGPAHTSDVWFTESQAGKIGRITTQ